MAWAWQPPTAEAARRPRGEGSSQKLASNIKRLVEPLELSLPWP